ncbi:RNA polymerase sigma-70 factor [uncultured Bacteroides sp.]|uniref:RNA polymerase sigma-70 factor n=1 Tax=uncultured Bacteroides sp. TaxID=162156 RepID=UPI002AABCDB3|nr:RNA polymerase sigma-70 factor [uncultured Bacteroides sp.]
MINDLLLLNRIKNGDVQAFEKLFRSYYKPLCYYADSFLNDMDSAEEIVQNLFYLFWKDRADLQIRLSVKSYLFQSVQNNAFSYLKHLQVRDVYRDKVAQEELETSNFSPVDELEYRELESKFTSLLQQLPERQRRIFCMNRFGGKKYSEIAKELSVSVKTVEADISKVLVILRKELKHYNQ